MGHMGAMCSRLSGLQRPQQDLREHPHLKTLAKLMYLVPAPVKCPDPANCLSFILPTKYIQICVVPHHITAAMNAHQT